MQSIKRKVSEVNHQIENLQVWSMFNHLHEMQEMISLSSRLRKHLKSMVLGKEIQMQAMNHLNSSNNGHRFNHLLQEARSIAHMTMSMPHYHRCRHLRLQDHLRTCHIQWMGPLSLGLGMTMGQIGLDKR